MTCFVQGLLLLAGLTLAAGLHGCGGGTTGSDCLLNDDCVENFLCDRGECRQVPAVKIVTLILPDATQGMSYGFTLEAAHGVPPLRWSLQEKPGWMSIDEDSGTLSGEPDAPGENLVVRVMVIDATLGRDSTAEEELAIDVRLCHVDQQAPCYQQGGGRCQQGNKRCAGNEWGACQELSESSVPDHCGAECTACDARVSDSCNQGVCGCGTGPTCAQGSLCCAGRCIDAATDASNCGGCGIDCGTGGTNVGGLTCVNGTCAVGDCEPAHLDCNNDPADGCETPMSEQRCGACDRNCSAQMLQVAAAQCLPIGSGYDCGYDGQGTDGQGCQLGYLDCDGDRTNGCETVQSNDNCGTCETTCKTQCLPHPDGDRTYCGCDDDGDCGPEAQCCGGSCFQRNDPFHCGGCSNDCSLQVAHAVSLSCDQGACDYTACVAGTLDCDGNRENGCETPVSDDNCGTCSTACGANASCDGSNCVCDAHFGNCNGSWANGCEADFLTSTVQCGACGNDCNALVLHASGKSCGGGLCNFGACDVGFGDCDGDRHNGCEKGLWQVESCGSGCSNGVNCSTQVQHAADKRCSGGLCDYGSCAAGFDNCDNSRQNGCETGIWETSSCGTTCGNRLDCNLQVLNASGKSCASGLCDFGSCQAGYDSCDANRANGCETDIWETASCGGNCGNRIDCSLLSHTTGPHCDSGQCHFSGCAASWGNCDATTTNGCETQLWETTRCRTSCGDTGPNCNQLVANAAGKFCDQGSCSYVSCTGGYGNCDGNRSNGCEKHIWNDVNNCGGCGNSCIAAGGTNTCAGNHCVPTCNGYNGNCDGDPDNGCETMLVDDDDNCGSCGHKCTGGTRCCGLTCRSVCN